MYTRQHLPIDKTDMAAIFPGGRKTPDYGAMAVLEVLKKSLDAIAPMAMSQESTTGIQLRAVCTYITFFLKSMEEAGQAAQRASRLSDAPSEKNYFNQGL